MRLKQLSLQGYKTFASKTEFIFDEGITVIVGPNGSGKSNIADAVRWVLGEQSYSTLRGKRTTDMIFAGSQSRARAGMAQVILTLDNTGGWLPIDYSEVEIGRRAYRSGENEYILNGQKVRLRDLTELLGSSGLAERTYTIIGQGLIDQALSLRAEERRALFEEAAGVSHYKHRRAETLRRLQETQHNLERVQDILAEIGPRLRSLERQASRARNYEQVETDLRHLLRIWYGYQWEQAKKNLRHRRKEAVEAENLWLESRQRLRRQQERLDEQRRRLSQQQKQVSNKQSERDVLREQLEQARRRTAVLAERQTLLEKQIADIEEELPGLQEQQAMARQELAGATAELELAQRRLAEGQQEQQNFQVTFQARQPEIDQGQRELKRLEAQQRDNQNRLAQAEGQMAQLQERLQEKQLAAHQVDEIAELEARLAQLAAVAESAQAAVDERKQERSRSQEERRNVVARLKEMRRRYDEANQQLNKLNNEVARLQARYDLLAQMRGQESQLNSDVPLLGHLASLITIPATYQEALEAALNERLATLVVNDENDLWRLVGNNGRDLTLIAAASGVQPFPSPPTPDNPAVVGWASELVTPVEAIKPVVQLLLGQVLVVEDREAAYQISCGLPVGALAVALDGFIAHAGGLVEINRSNGQNSVLAQEEAWRAAAAGLEGQKVERARLGRMVSSQEREIHQWQETVDRLNEEERRLGRLEQEAVQRLAQARQNLDRARQQRDFLQRQQQANATEISDLAQRLAGLQQTISEQRESVLRLEAAVGEARTHLQTLPIAEAQQQRHNLRQQIESAQTILAGRQAVVDSRRSTLKQIDGQLQRQQGRLEELHNMREKLELVQEKNRLEQLQTGMDQLDALLSPLKNNLAESQQVLAGLEEEIAICQKQTHELETRFTQAKIGLSQYENQVEGLRDRIRTDLGLVALSFDEDQIGQSPLPIAEVVDELPLITELPGDIEESIQRYRGQLHRMGNVNIEAPAEYEETQARFEFLGQQVEDLNKTEQQLRRVITELDDLTSRSFASTVEKVDGLFGETFTRLFGGGSARLILTDPDDLTISGVDIVARLPSRRQQGLALLSGGERSLTAAALIFALLKVSPTPFCILDEVDAMLDEANVGRFREVLLELSEQTQIIVITHNRGTVQVACTLYGISMGADSTSQVLSLKPKDYAKG